MTTSYTNRSNANRAAKAAAAKAPEGTTYTVDGNKASGYTITMHAPRRNNTAGRYGCSKRPS